LEVEVEAEVKEEEEEMGSCACSGNFVKERFRSWSEYRFQF
jgi:hypothetical protein